MSAYETISIILAVPALLIAFGKLIIALLAYIDS